MAASEMDEKDELERLKKECNAMMRYIKKLHRQEKDLRQRNEMIAREALLCGFQPDALEPQPPKQRRKASQHQPPASNIKEAVPLL
jgi:phosphorylcholine metabolism protein LicD